MSIWSDLASNRRQDCGMTSAGPRFQSGTAYLLAMAGATSRRQWMEGLARLNVTPSQFKVIMALHEVDSLGQRQLAELIGIDPRNCVPIIDSLVEADLVSRQIDGTDRRRRDLRLTSAGRHLAAELESVNAETEAMLTNSLSSTDRKALHRMLLAILAAADET